MPCACLYGGPTLRSASEGGKASDPASGYANAFGGPFSLTAPDGVSVDPGHDKPVDLGNYVAPITSLIGANVQLEQIKKGYGVYSAKVPQPGGDAREDGSLR